MKPPVLILAGSRPDASDPVAEAEGVPHKALARIGRQTLLERVVLAVRDFGANEIAVAASDPAVEDEVRRLGAILLPIARGPSESVRIAFERYGAPLLVTTADHPLLEAGWLQAMVEQTPEHADVSLMLARRDAVEAVVPDTRRTWISLADGQWSGCNLFLLARPAAGLAIDTWRKVEADRKRPWKIAFGLGFGTLFDFLRGKLTMPSAIRRVGRRFGIAAEMVPAPDGRAAIDVDKPADLALVRRLAGE